jgi:hypothetical protein
MQNTQRLLFFALIATVVWGLMMSWEASQFKKQDCPKQPLSSSLACQATGPISELELAPTHSVFEAVIQQGKGYETWNIETARVNTWMDFLFIMLYWSVFSLLSFHYPGRLHTTIQLLISIAAVFDVAENIYLLYALRAMSSLQPPASLPVFVSRIKWSFFAATVFLLGILMARKRERLPVLIAALMLISAPLTVAGIAFRPFLLPAVLVLFLSLVIAIFAYFPFGPFTWDRLLVWIEFAYLIRFQVIGAILLVVVLPAGYFAAPSVFTGIFDALGPKSFTFVVWATLQLAWTIMITSRLVIVYGPSRFHGVKTIVGAAEFQWSSAALFACLAAPCILMTCCGTFLPAWQMVVAILFGVLIAVAFLWLTAELHRYLEGPVGKTAFTIYPQFRAIQTGKQIALTPQTFLDRLLQRLPAQLQPGILSADGRLRSGHRLAGTAFLALFVVYALLGLYYSPGLNLGKHPPAALFYVLYLLVLFTWFFSGLAFFLDILRLPVLTTFVAISLLLGMVGTDHEFEIRKASQHFPSPLPQDVVKNWKINRGGGDPKKPIIVVATAGGGIRAAAWTAEVITRLANSCEQTGTENKFSSSLLLVSSVSGGSVGAMYVVSSYDADGHWHDELGDRVRKNAAQTSLSAVGWGFLYPDLLRMIPLAGSLTGLLGGKIDRGWALENAWLRQWDGHLWQTPPTIDEWRDDVANGRKPAVIFNATSAESGQRFLIASTTLAPNAIGDFKDSSTIQFSTELKEYDVDVATAARLSATFPWVSPMARASEKEAESRVHVADGGYYDNSGVLSASEWLLEAQPEIGHRTVEFILIDSSSSSPASGQRWSWQRQIVAPIGTLLGVRTSSQNMRAEYELELVRDDLRRQGFDLLTFRLPYPSDPLTPLSWHLTPEQERQIGKAWSSKGIREQAQGIVQPLGCSIR